MDMFVEGFDFVVEGEQLVREPGDELFSSRSPRSNHGSQR